MAAAFALVMVQEKFPVACRWRICHCAQPTRIDSLPWYVHGDQVNKGLSKEKCHAQLRQNSLGGEMGWRYGQSQVWYLLQFLAIGCWVSQGISCDLMLLPSVIPCYFIVIWNHIIFWMTSIFLTQLTMSVSPAAPAVHEALWKLRSCWRCNDMYVVWLRTAMGFGCCYKNRDQRWMIQFDEIMDIYGSYIILSFWIWTDLDEIMNRCSMMFRRLQSVMNLASNLPAQCCCSIWFNLHVF